MIINHSRYLSDKTKKSIIEQRLAQFHSEIWQHEVNKKAFTEVDDQESLEQTDKALKLLMSLLSSYEEELKTLTSKKGK